MKFSIFDLDQTLLPIDSGELWSRWLAERIEPEKTQALTAEIERHAAAYREGAMDAEAFVRFQCGLLARAPRAKLQSWRQEFLESVVAPHVTAAARGLLRERREAGFTLVLATGTHRFVTAPIAEMLGIEHLAAAEPEVGADGSFTGRCRGSHSYGKGKLRLVEALLSRLLDGCWEAMEAVEAWSDSINDLPLLEWAASAKSGRPVAVNPDARLRRRALERGWEIRTLN